jgi:hypothetical protein
MWFLSRLLCLENRSMDSELSCSYRNHMSSRALETSFYQSSSHLQPQLLGSVFSKKLQVCRIISTPGLNIQVQSLRQLRLTTLPMSHCCVKNRLLVGVPSLFASLGLQVCAPRLLISSKCSLLWEQISWTVRGGLEAE